MKGEGKGGAGNKSGGSWRGRQGQVMRYCHLTDLGLKLEGNMEPLRCFYQDSDIILGAGDQTKGHLGVQKRDKGGWIGMIASGDGLIGERVDLLNKIWYRTQCDL